MLRQAIAAARMVEEVGLEKASQHPLEVVGLGFLVRHRRIARAIERLGRESAYESRILLRAMLETQINYAWIRLRQSRSRALRFVKYLAIDRLRLLEKSSTIFRPADYSERKAALEAERASVRHLFRFRNKKTKMQWARSWASVPSVEGRLIEVQKKVRPSEAPDPFLYGMYIWFSAATHGSIDSLADPMVIVDGRLALKEPESKPNIHRVGAFILLAWTLEAFTEDAKLTRQCQPKMREFMKTVAELRSRAKYLRTAA